MKKAFLILAMVLPGRAVCQLAQPITHDPELRAVDRKWRPRYEFLMRRGEFQTGEVIAATRAALRPKATKVDIYRAILIRDVNDFLYQDENPVEAEKIKRAWQALNVPPSYESKKATLLCDSAGWGVKETVGIAKEIFDLDREDIQVTQRAGVNLLGYYSGSQPLVNIVKQVSSIFEKLCDRPNAIIKLRGTLALTYLMLSNLQKEQRKRFLLKAKDQYLQLLGDPFRTPKGERNTRFWLRQVDQALAEINNGGG